MSKRRGIPRYPDPEDEEGLGPRGLIVLMLFCLALFALSMNMLRSENIGHGRENESATSPSSTGGTEEEVIEYFNNEIDRFEKSVDNNSAGQ